MSYPGGRALYAAYNKNQHFTFDFEREKVFISRQKEWLNSIHNKGIHNNKAYETYRGSNDGKVNHIYNTTKPFSVEQAFCTENKNFVQHNNGQDNSKYIGYNKDLFQFQADYTLARTVKHNNLQNKKNHSEKNTQKFKPLSARIQHNSQFQKKLVERKSENFDLKEEQKKQKPIIMSIDQIRQIQRQMINGRGIHKIKSSASRSKLKTSSSKDSKGSSSNFQNKQLKISAQKTQRYNKYMQNELVNVNIDLRKQIAASSFVPHLNVRKFGPHPTQNKVSHQNIKYERQNQNRNQDLSHYHPVNDHQKEMSTIKTQNVQHNQKQTQKPTVFYQIRPQHINDFKRLVDTPLNQKVKKDAENKLENQINQETLNLATRNDRNFTAKSRSKSNLSKYSQYRQNQQSKQNRQSTQCLLNCEQKGQNQHNLSNFSQKTPERNPAYSFSSDRKVPQKIHVLCYSSAHKNQQRNIINKENPQANLRNSVDFNFQIRPKLQNGQVYRSKKTYNGLQTSRQRNSNEHTIFQNNFLTGSSRGGQGNRSGQSNRGGQSNGLAQMIEQKIKRKPIRLTLHKRN